MSGVDGRSHHTSTLGGTELASLGLRRGPGQAVVESEGGQYLTKVYRFTLVASFQVYNITY